MPQIEEYQVLYVPYPLGISDEDCKKLREWVKKGGTLISEGCFGYFTENGHASEISQPNRGFDEVFGCTQKTVHLGPDANKELTVQSVNGTVRGGVYRQAYTLTSGQAEGYYENGEIAAVSHTYGEGKALLIGTMPGYGYHHAADETSRRWFASLLRTAGVLPAAAAPYNENVTIRLWKNGNAAYAWIFNFADMDQKIEVEFQEEVAEPVLLRGTAMEQTGKTRVTVRVQKKDAAIVKIHG